MKTAILICLISPLFASYVWAQKSESTVFFEKNNGKVLRIEKYKSVEVVSEKNFTIPIYTLNEETLFRLDRNHTTYNKEKLTKLVAEFISNNKKHFNTSSLKSVDVTCYFDKSTFELQEITYNLDPTSVNKYSILRDLSEEIKTKGDLSVSSGFRARVDAHRSIVNTYTAKYYYLYFTLRDSDLKPYLNEGKNKK